MKNLSLNAVVTQRIELTPDLVILRVVPEGNESPRFKPGQFAVLGLPDSAPRYAYADDEEDRTEPAGVIRRAYSIASSSVAREYLEFYITLVRSGALTPRLFALGTGARLCLSPKVSGLFTLDQVSMAKHVVMVATGTGLAPYMSMLRTHMTCGGPRRFAVLHGARHSWDLGYRSELISLSRLCSNFTYIPIISRPEEEPVRWTGASGYVQDLWMRKCLRTAWGFEPVPSDTEIFLCGNPAMVETMAALLSKEGFREPTRNQSGEIHVERYW